MKDRTFWPRLALVAVWAVLMLSPELAKAADVTINWQLLTTDCNGDPMEATDYDEIEIFVAEDPIPALDITCPTEGDPSTVDARPAGGNVILTARSPNALTGDINVNLLGGQTYFARARVSDQSGNWSNLSAQVEVVVPQGIVRPPVIIQIGG